MVKLSVLLACLGTGVLTASILQAEAPAGDWPQYKRDSARTGDAPEEVLELPLRRVVAVRLPAPIYASPAVVGGRAYVQDARGHVVCVNGAANKVVWTASIGGVTNMSSPAVADGKVFVGSSAGHLAILEAATGRLLAKVPGGSGVIAAPALAGGAVYFSTLDGKLIKIAYDGRVLWRFDGGQRSHLEFAVRGREILFFAGVQPGGDPVALHHLLDEGETVKVLHKFKAGNYPTGGMVFAPGRRGGYQRWHAEFGSFVIFPWDQEGKIQFPAYQEDVIDSRVTPSLRGDRFYFAERTGIVSAALETVQDPKAGPQQRVKTFWKAGWPYYGPSGFNSSPALARDYAVAGCDNGRVYFYALQPKAKTKDKAKEELTWPKPVWSFDTTRPGQPNSSVTSSPAVAGGRVYFGGEDGILYGLGKGADSPVVDAVKEEGPYDWPGMKLKGPEWITARGDMGFSAVSPDTHLLPPLKLKWRTRIFGSFKSSLIAAGGRVFAASRSGQLTALDAETGEIVWRTIRPYTNTFPAPVYADGKLLTFCRGTYKPKDAPDGAGVWCHNARTGQLLWRLPQPVPTGAYDAAAGIPVHGGKALVCWDGGAGRLETAAYDLTTGREVWKVTRPAAYPGELKGYAHAAQGVIGDGTWFCSVVKYTVRDPYNEKHTGPPRGSTLAIDPATGKMLWQNDQCHVFHFLGKQLAYRKGTLVVFGEKESWSLDPGTGRVLWTGKPANYAFALTDAYLESKGQKDLLDPGCGYTVYDNGFWYGIAGYGRPMLAAWTFDEKGRRIQPWTFGTMGRGCPAACPAYGRLYYSPNCEGVIYCFENAEGNSGKPGATSLGKVLKNGAKEAVDAVKPRFSGSSPDVIVGNYSN